MWTPTQLFYVCQVLQCHPCLTLWGKKGLAEQSQKPQQNPAPSGSFSLGKQLSLSIVCLLEWAPLGTQRVDHGGHTAPAWGEKCPHALGSLVLLEKTSTTTHSSIPLSSSWVASTFFYRLLFKESVHFLTKLLDDWKDLVPVPTPEVAPAGSALLSNHLILAQLSWGWDPGKIFRL